jgi:predicted DNA-binding protein (MmcQ/YjbR family)
VAESHGTAGSRALPVEFAPELLSAIHMNIDSLRKFCLSFPHATEKLQWGEELCFKVDGKIFAMVGLGAVPQTLICKCDPETFAEMTEREGIVPAPYVGRYKWVMLEHLDALTEGDLKELITRSYAMVAAKAKIKKKIPAVRTSRRPEAPRSRRRA